MGDKPCALVLRALTLFVIDRHFLKAVGIENGTRITLKFTKDLKVEVTLQLVGVLALLQGQRYYSAYSSTLTSLSYLVDLLPSDGICHSRAHCVSDKYGNMFRGKISIFGRGQFRRPPFCGVSTSIS